MKRLLYILIILFLPVFLMASGMDMGMDMGMDGGTVASGGGPAVGDGLLLETGTDFLILENGDYLLLE